MLTCYGVLVEVRGQPRVSVITFCLSEEASVLFIVVLASLGSPQPCCNYPVSGPSPSRRVLRLQMCDPTQLYTGPLASKSGLDCMARTFIHSAIFSHLHHFVRPTFLFLFFQNSNVTNVRSFSVSWVPGTPVSASSCVSLCCPQRFVLIILFPEL